jgi:hypothetical protein
MQTNISALFLAVLIGSLLAAPRPVLAGDGSDSGDLIGRWDQGRTDGFVRFFPDGSFRWRAPANVLVEGRYRVLSGGAIELSLFPGPGQRLTDEFKYTLEGDTLRLKVANRWVVYKRSP